MQLGIETKETFMATLGVGTHKRASISGIKQYDRQCNPYSSR